MNSLDKGTPLKISKDNIQNFIDASDDRIVRREKDMNGFFMIDSDGEDIVYEVFEIEGGHHSNMAITTMKPGKVGDEYYMTKGHFHESPSADEMYFCLSGKGLLLLRSREGAAESIEFDEGSAAYVPEGMAHRTVNIGKEELVFLAIYPKDAGHDYGSIEKSGFGSVVVERNGAPAIESNEN